jgi:hypothetical protein
LPRQSPFNRFSRSSGCKLIVRPASTGIGAIEEPQKSDQAYRRNRARLSDQRMVRRVAVS